MASLKRPDPDWRDQATYESLLHAGRSGLAWEFLRRDSRYGSAQRDASFSEVAGARIHTTHIPEEEALAARRWGLCFQGGSPPQCGRRARLLAAGDR